jgi:hypothetical protein
VALSVYLSAVNQKLLFAKQLIALLDSAKSSRQGAFKDSHQVEAIAQSVAVQLYQAWHFHLRDIASNYKLASPDDVTSAEILVEMLAAEDKCPAEATEMQALVADSESWVAELFNAQAQVYELPVIRKAEMDVDRLPMIAVDATNAEGAKLVDWTLERAQLWLTQLQELVDRQRDMMVEF